MAKSKIETAREARGWSRAKLARKLGAPIRTLENWESGSRKPPEWIEKIIIEKIESME